MRDCEFDRVWEWLWGTRLRAFAMVWAICAIGIGSSVYGVAVSQAGADLDWSATEICGGSDGKVVSGYDKAGLEQYIKVPVGKHVVVEDGRTGVCSDGGVVIEADWTEHLGVLGITALVTFSPWLLVMTNFLLLSLRAYSRVTRLRWTQSATKHALDERSKRVRAEELSAAAERETERLERELEALGVPR